MVDICGGSGGGKSGGGRSGGGGGSDIDISGTMLEVTEKESAFHKSPETGVTALLSGATKAEVESALGRAAKDITREESRIAKGLNRQQELANANAEHRVWTEIMKKGAYGPNAKNCKFKF